jgi:hypothetical protein
VIKEHVVVKNLANGNRLVVGNCCCQKWGTEYLRQEAALAFKDLGRLKAARKKAVDAARKRAAARALQRAVAPLAARAALARAARERAAALAREAHLAAYRAEQQASREAAERAAREAQSEREARWRERAAAAERAARAAQSEREARARAEAAERAARIAEREAWARAEEARRARDAEYAWWGEHLQYAELLRAGEEWARAGGRLCVRCQIVPLAAAWRTRCDECQLKY